MVQSISVLIANEPGEVVQVPCQVHEPIFFLLQRLRIKVGLEAKAVLRHQLAINGIFVEDERTSLADCRIFGDGVTYKFWRNPPPKIYLEPSMTIYVKSFTGKIVNVPCHVNNTIYDVKELINDKETIPPEQQRLSFQGDQLEDTRTLLEYSIQNDSTLHLSLRLGGGDCFQSNSLEFADVFDRSNVHKITLGNGTTPGRWVKPGTIIVCRCECTPGYLVNCNRGFSIVEMTKERFTCPVCHESHRITPVTAGFRDCEYRFMGTKLSGEQYTSKWFKVLPKDEYQRFDPGKQTTWDRLMIHSRLRFEVDNCVVCLEPGYSVQKLDCGHAYHKKCHDSLRGSCVSCKFDKQLQDLEAR